ncbi:Holliday junction resolvase RuvX [Thiomicrospira pelophila]|uniref:Holliday junction resolvase RuvX n=1 Tax=Thiomicrospira pelophila TaxID=934 RepID=UPI0004A722C2|nr:Holliday junction resolvase RuvX [Thiomicrospira pelophila]
MPKLPEGLVIGFDFGLKRIGVAIGQTVTRTASPQTIVNSRDGVPDWKHITQLIEHWNPVAIVVGLPMHLDGSEQPFTQSARKFGQRLHGRYQRPLFFIEEQLSSHEAEQRLKSRAQATTLLDAHAAQIILENWLSHYDDTEL